jgi:hypothetical protein
VVRLRPKRGASCEGLDQIVDTMGTVIRHEALRVLAQDSRRRSTADIDAIGKISRAGLLPQAELPGTIKMPDNSAR